MDLLIIEAAQAGGIEPETRGLRADVRGEVKGTVGVEIRVAIETSYTVALLGDLAVLGLIEFFLWERGAASLPSEPA
jgi:hypothetical protein